MTVEVRFLADGHVSRLSEWPSSRSVAWNDYVDSLFHLAPKALKNLVPEEAKKKGLALTGVVAERLLIMLRRRNLAARGELFDRRLWESLAWHEEVIARPRTLKTTGHSIKKVEGYIGYAIAPFSVANRHWDAVIWPLCKRLSPLIDDAPFANRGGTISGKQSEKIVIGLRRLLMTHPEVIELAPMPYFEEGEEYYRPSDSLDWDLLTKLYEIVTFSNGMAIS